MIHSVYAELKTKIHNAKQTVESLRRKRKKARGRLAALHTEIAQVEKSLHDIERKLPDAKAFLRAFRAAYKHWGD